MLFEELPLSTEIFQKRKYDKILINLSIMMMLTGTWLFVIRGCEQ